MDSRDYLWPQLQELPYFRALLRAVEARAYESLELPEPSLDLGSGDGSFAAHAFERPLTVGLDPAMDALQEARSRGVYRLLVQADGGYLPFPRGYYASAISNSVLEHIPQVEAVLRELGRVMMPGAPLIFCVPNHRLTETLSVARLLDRMNVSRLANAYRRFFNRISRHVHCDPPDVWQARLTQAGFSLERWWHYFSPAALRTLEWGHYFGLPSLISRGLTGRWILSRARWNLTLTDRLVRPYYDEPVEHEEGVYTFYVARRSGRF